jgi:hypothetical protein
MNTEKRDFIHKMMNEAKAYCEQNLNEKAIATFSLSERAGNGETDYYGITTIVYGGPILETDAKECFSVSFPESDTSYETCGKALDYLLHIHNAVAAINEDAKQEDESKPVEQTPIVSIHKTGDEVDGVRVCVGDEDFVIALKDAEDQDDEDNEDQDDEDNEDEWAEAYEKFNLPTVKQAHLIAAYLDEIQAKLVEAGGEKLSDNWSLAEYAANIAWFYYGTSGYVDYYNKSYSNGVRHVLASNA